ncbi:1-deoxy-D-xylulose-5-phosphate synthase [Suttonella sp. R2A3]|uniref:1-deoxy-D-xylulose-5-phosphate synthase n=1 Tax=Suttonella sp. R2A3 TaxID=2908648 RepID=UPI001F432D4F|nr:1-deoxy-D-xylulose-5-phosphate synthase [Suttonella sp. R2A3]UJF25096.1 1-deoxy-D-xylulose-5-phosphate synthase [Suttonella sp. R2A3]
MIELDTLRKQPIAALPAVCETLREEIITICAKQGGHLASSLGAVELVVTLHYVLDTPNASVCFDVGHQAYAHKLLTGRWQEMQRVRAPDGAAPFPLRSESAYDAFAGGHAGNALSAAAGFAAAGQSSIALMGDGSLTCGMTFEALNHIGDKGWGVLAIVNDNGYSIDDNVGALKRFGNLEAYARSLGWDYVGIDDGHDIAALVSRLRALLPITKPILWHVRTQKGKGLIEAETDPVAWHGRPANTVKQSNTTSAASVLSSWLIERMAQDSRIHMITPAMMLGSGLSTALKHFPERVHDVGIAEQHALSFAAGLAAAGQKPIIAIYATFLQRGYDQLVHDIALQNLPVTLCVDRAGAVGGDGDTHIGAYDMVMSKALPNLCVAAPATARELTMMLDWAQEQSGPVLLRYPRDLPNEPACHEPIEYGRAVVCRRGHGWLIIAVGELLATLMPLAQEKDATLVNLRFIKPFDRACLSQLVKAHDRVLIVESGVQMGGIGHDLAAWINTQVRLPVVVRGLPDEPLGSGSTPEQMERAGLSLTHLRTLLDGLNLT